MNRRIIVLSIIMAALLVIAGGAVMAFRALLPGLSAKLPFVSNVRVVEFHEYFALDPAVCGLLMGDKRVLPEAPPIVEDGTVYLPLDFVKLQMDTLLFWDEYANRLYYTSLTDVSWYRPGLAEFNLNGESKRLATPIRLINDTVYLPSDMLEALYPYDIAHAPEYNMAIVTGRAENPSIGVISKKTYIRYRADKRADVAKKADKDEEVIVYEQEGGFYRVRTADGLLGYVPVEHLTYKSPPEKADSGNGAAIPGDYPRLWPVNEKINLMWEACYSERGTRLWMETPLPDGLNVISPTWFSFDADDNYALVSFGSREYTDWARGQNVKVWGMLEDTSGNISHAVLTDANIRARTIEGLLRFADEYGLDGINIDFEHVREADGDYFIQFLRELAPPARKKGLIVSVDVYVPSAWSAYYKRGIIGDSVDFVCVMTYDEHYPGSPVSGPVASLPFVFKGVEDMLKEVPADKLLMGLPYYNRVWREIVNNDSPETRGVDHYNMEYTKALFSENGAQMEWEPMAGCYYGEYATVEDGEIIRHRVWLEDEYSIAEKLKIFEKHNLAGVAGWRRGFENEIVWQLLKRSCGVN